MGDVCRNEEQILALIGLGNPGKEYAGTRHNAGFQVIDRLIALYSPSMMERKFRASWGFAMAEGRKVLFAKPLTYMNRSGEAVGELIKYFGIPPGKMMVVHDDLDLRVRAGSALPKEAARAGTREFSPSSNTLAPPISHGLKWGWAAPNTGSRSKISSCSPPTPKTGKTSKK